MTLPSLAGLSLTAPNTMLARAMQHEPAIKIDATLQDVLNTGLSKNIIMMLVQALKPTEAAKFFQIMSIEEVDMGGGLFRHDAGMLTTEWGSEQAARLIWSTAGEKFFGAPEGSIRSRDKFERVMRATMTRLPLVWGNILFDWLLDDEPIADFVCRSYSGIISGETELYFDARHVFNITSLIIAMSLDAETPYGRDVQLSLKIQLAEAVKEHEIKPWVASNTTFKILSDSLTDSAFKAELDPFLANIVHSTTQRMVSPKPTFETAMIGAASKGDWLLFCRELGAHVELDPDEGLLMYFLYNPTIIFPFAPSPAP